MNAQVFTELLGNVKVRENHNGQFFIIEAKANEYELHATCDRDFENLDVDRIAFNGCDDGEMELTPKQEYKLTDAVCVLVEDLNDYETAC